MGALRILIADDHELVRRGLRSLLEIHPQWSVCAEAADGEQAVALARQHQPQVVLLDISMPSLNGLDAARAIRRDLPQSAIVIVSQHDSTQMREAAAAAGAQAYIAKSQIARDLVAEVEKIVRRKSAHGVGVELPASPPPNAPLPAKIERRQNPRHPVMVDSSATSNGAVSDDLEWLTRGGEVGALVRSKDWSQTPLGPLERWPQSLRTALSISLHSRFELFIWWGPELIVLYNDAYKQTLASKHPWALGRPGEEVWSEIWDVIGPMLHRVLETGEATWSDDLRLILERHGYPEETYHTFSYSPIRDESGAVGGVFTAVTQTTERVIGERRLRTLRDLAARAADATNEPEAWNLAAEVLGENPYDVPFSVLYQLDDESARATAAGYAGIDPSHSFCPARVALSGKDSGLSGLLNQVIARGEPVEVREAEQLGFDLPGGGAGLSPHELILLPLSQTGVARPLGVLVAGVSRLKRLDESYRTFFNLVAGQIAKSIADAQAFERERKRAEALAELDRAKTAFFSNVSHEFRTPLTLMLGPLEDTLAKSRNVLPAEDLEQLTVVHRNSLRLLKLVNSLLDFSRIEAGRVQALYQPTDLGSITSELASVFRSAMEKAGLRFRVECDPLPEPVYVDRDMWEKIVLNLLSNAFKFTFEGEIFVGLKASTGMVHLTVRDSGTGIPERELPRLFERFHRVEGSRGRTHEGTGIGLALVQELVRLHGGTVEVESIFGQGSAFTVSIPCGSAHLPQDQIEGASNQISSAIRADSYVEEALRWFPEQSGAGETSNPLVSSLQSLSAPPSPTDSPGGRREVIVLADDNADMREYLRRLLSSQYQVHAVSDGAMALAAVREIRPDLVLTDVMMPVLDGFGLLRAIREDADTKATPLILLSARAGEESRVEGLQAGADDYLVKPFTARELLARVGAHLKMAGIRRQASELERQLRAEAEIERGRLRELFMQAPAPIAMLSGPQHRFAFVNSAYVDVTGRRSVDDFLGKPVAETLPEIQAQGYVDLLDRAYRSGEPYVGTEMKVALNRGPSGKPEEAFFDFVYQPMRSVTGEVEGILVHAVEVTEQVQARTRLEERVLERTAELERAEQSLRHLSGRLILMQDEERRRIARELHDSAGQLLAALSMNLAPLQDTVKSLGTNSARAAAECLSLVAQLNSELRTISHLLHPPMLDEAGLDMALQWYVEGFAERSNIAVQFELASDIGRLSRELETTVFRIVQECLTNIHRHAASPTASVQISRQDSHIRLEVSDQGKGFSSQNVRGGSGPVRPGVGIQGMRERVRQLGGKLDIESDGDGTRVRAELPIIRAAREDGDLEQAAQSAN